jgi:hypothetical protein
VNLTLLNSIGLAISGNDSACLSRLLGGAFVQNGLVLNCSNPNSCLVTLALDGPSQPVNVVAFKGDDQIRFRQFFRGKDDSFFETRATSGGALLIQCIEDRCQVFVANAGALPAPPSTVSRLNP